MQNGKIYAQTDVIALMHVAYVNACVSLLTYKNGYDPFDTRI